MRKILLVSSILLGAVVATPASAQADDVAPVAPAMVSASYATPARDGDGHYITPNQHLTPAEATWYLRSALNVAALNCRDAREPQTVAEYNGLLHSQSATLAAANDAVNASYRMHYGKAWENAHEHAMTKVYNFFAQPPAHDAFCAVAEQMLDEVATIAPVDFAGYAIAALPRLEAPFTEFYARYDQYRDAMAAWQARHGAPVMAAAAPVAVASAPTLARR
jgi:hypothetical protein